MSRRHARPVPPALADVLADLRAVIRVLRSDADPSTEVDPRAERLAAAAIAALVLLGAIGTYLVITGGLGPLFATTPANGDPARDRPPAVQPAGRPTPTGPATPSPTRSPTRPSSTSTPIRPGDRTGTVPAAQVKPAVPPSAPASPSSPTSPTATPSPEPSPSPSPTPQPSA